MRESKTLGKWVEFLRDKWYNKGSNSVTVTCNREDKGVDDVYSAMGIARYIIGRCIHEEIHISNLKLQKLLYFAWINFYKTTNKNIFDDDMYAWGYGPVIPDVYRKYCVYGGRSIWQSTLEPEVEICDEARKSLNATIESLARIDPFVLVDKSHKKDAPWDLVYRNGLGDREPIPVELIRKACDEGVL